MSLWNPNKPLNQPPHYGTGGMNACVCPADDARLALLIDKRREQAAKLAGVDLELAMEVGDRDAARKHLEEMKAQTLARHGAKFAAWEASH